MSSNELLRGLKVKISIEEDGTSNPPKLPEGTILRSFVGTDGVTYYLVRLDYSIRSLRAETGKEWDLYDLLIAPHFKGASIESNRSFPRASVHVAIANALQSLEPDNPVLDFSNVAYFGLGTVKRS